MAASRKDIKGWLKEAPEGATHVIIVCDTFDHEDYPVYVMAEESIFKKVEKINGKNMQRVEEVYDLSLGLEEQLNEERAFHY